ncbi:MAG: hypothetical protein HOK28_21920 [Deltaproteobacteria bacterium]|nr:hypothetical protein [Deltaproteobacteria bacterium]
MQVTPSVERGWIRGCLDDGEERERIIGLLHHAKSQALDGELTLRVHEHLKTNPDPKRVEEGVEEKLGLLYQNQLKRWVVQIETSQGPRIVKMTEVAHFRGSLAGLFSRSVAAREHKFQRRTQTLNLAAAQSKGYLELWYGPSLIRCCQIQTAFEPGNLILDDYLSLAMKKNGLSAMEPLGRALAHSHNQGFFHGDLKGFHAFAHPGAEPGEYTLRWLDLARVGFRLSRRQRIINLYQMLRFVVPERGDARDSFMRSYCAAARWHAGNPNKAMTIVGKFLEHKLKTHPNP